MMHESEPSRVVKMMIAAYFMALAIGVGCYSAFEAPTGYPTLSVVCRIGSIALIVFAILLDAQSLFGAVRHRPESRSVKPDEIAGRNIEISTSATNAGWAGNKAIVQRLFGGVTVWH